MSHKLIAVVIFPVSQITVLLNRRAVVSFEQLLLDISEALGFPRWHRARVTRLFTAHAHEVKALTLPKLLSGLVLNLPS